MPCGDVGRLAIKIKKKKKREVVQRDAGGVGVGWGGVTGVLCRNAGNVWGFTENGDEGFSVKFGGRNV